MEKIFTALTGRESVTPHGFSPSFPLLPEVSAFLVDTEINLFLKIKKQKNYSLPLDPPSSS